MIVVRGAQQHNLKHIDVTIPRNKLVVLTGVCGSGKSSLAFDTLYAEGQRRYVESLSAYARQFLGQMEKPKVDYIGGLSPAIAIEQKAVSKNPRSTVGTVTEMMDYLRVLFSRAGHAALPAVRARGQAQSARSRSPTSWRSLPPGTRFQLLAPLARNRKGDHAARARSRPARTASPARASTASCYELLSVKSLPKLDKKPEAHHRADRRPAGRPATRTSPRADAEISSPA